MGKHADPNGPHLSREKLVASFCAASSSQIPPLAAPAVLETARMMAFGMDLFNMCSKFCDGSLLLIKSNDVLRGTRGPVLVLPGFMADDDDTAKLRHNIHDLGYTVHAWKHGVNAGPNEEVIRHLEEHLSDIHTREGPVTLVGWSMGGIFAHEMRRRFPDMIKGIITLGSPYTPAPGDDALGVPVTAIYSHNDTVVQDPRDCICPGHPAIDVGCSHVDLVTNPRAFAAIRQALEGESAPLRKAFRPARTKTAALALQA